MTPTTTDAMTALDLRPNHASTRPCVAIGPLHQHPPAQRHTVQTEQRSDDGPPTVAKPTLHTPPAHQAHRPLSSELVGESSGVVPGTPSFLHGIEPPWNPGRFTRLA
jgi:hypothetical protein